MEQQIENSAVLAENVSESEPVLPGAALREARERIGLSVADAAGQTKLAPRQIEALEADDYQHLPEMAFVRGFVRSYAKLLQLDAQPLLAALPQTRLDSAQVSPTAVNVPFPDARSPQLQNLIWLGAALLLSVIVVAFAVWHYTSPSTPAEPEQSQPVETAIPLPAEMQVIPASAVEEAFASSVASAVPAAQSSVQAAQAAPIFAIPPVNAIPPVKQPLAVSAVKPAQSAAVVTPVPATPAAKPAAAKSLPVSGVAATKPVASAAPAQPASLRLTFGAESWTEVRDRNGNIVSSQLNPAGSELSLSGQGPFTLVVGRASSARLSYKGKTVDLKPNTNATSDVARVTLE